MRTADPSTRLRRLGVIAPAGLAAVFAAAGPAAAHTEVTASRAQALAENVTLTFTNEAESDSAGFTKIRIVLPAGITPDAVTVKEAPKGWKLRPTADGYTVGGPALAPGKDAEHSIVVRQLPDAKSLAFKTLDTYSDGKVSRWIELPTGGAEPEKPAPVLKLKAAAPGAAPISPSPSTGADSSPSSSETSAAASEIGKERVVAQEADASGNNNGITIVAVLIGAMLALAGAVLWFKRPST
ncbi:DUF1775 domain-containing protein [Actinacidiphila oryziradicis]|uniref:DUF1775 domain-containing protein n=1 Tax=Actinacidiphila oryziradicis TaxID=2571141 RepID=A0A4U0RY54_9ACTN|nr:DUF1775 domain-containing protein [Actinacidiphila oryziradicis]TKA00613.1 DUF1775 domain-containing protein [Actinacidiphila oryziradicis]